jgi:hypothetical protein
MTFSLRRNPWFHSIDQHFLPEAFSAVISPEKLQFACQMQPAINQTSFLLFSALDTELPGQRLPTHHPAKPAQSLLPL